MTIVGGTRTYRYVADARLAAAAKGEAIAALRSPRLLVSFAFVGLLLGIGASISANAASLPDHRDRVILIGTVWGLGWALVVLLLVLLLANAINRRMMVRLFPLGSSTEVEVGRDSLVIRRPTGTRSVPYQAIFRVRARRSVLRIELRGRPVAELLPNGLLPADEIEFIHLRSRGLWPLASAPEQRSPDRTFVVPPRWAAQVAGVVTRDALRGAEFWVRFGLTLLVSVLLATLGGRVWLFLAPVLSIAGLLYAYVGTHRAVAATLPAGALASADFLEDRLITRNSVGLREIPIATIRAMDIYGDVVLLRLRSGTKTVAIALCLIPDDLLGRFVS